MEVGFKTDKGKVRFNNEDACFVILPDKFYVVADGVGGGNCGEIASRTAVNEMANYVISHPINELDNKYAVVNYLTDCIDKTNRKIYDMARTYEANRGMATTVVAMHIYDKKAFIINVGDSRCYLYRDNELFQITEDHTYVNTLVHAGIIDEDQAKLDKRRNMITKALGAEYTVEPDFYQLDISPNDIFILCTDGLYSEVEKKEIEEAIRKNHSMSDLSANLIERANKNGGHDNITLITLKVTEEDL